MGEIAVTVVTDDGVELVTTSTTLSWEEPVEPEGFNGTVIAFGVEASSSWSPVLPYS